MSTDVIIIGAGFTGLSAAYELSRNGYKVKILESSESIGGLAGTFKFSDGVELEKFYHHWFNNDIYITKLVEDLGRSSEIITSPTSTGIYFNKRIWKFSKPADLLAFKALPIIDRLRLGLLVYRVRFIRDWKLIEHLNIKEWLIPLCGKKVYETIWQPLINSKFSSYADSISAVWMWKKLVLRGSTRDSKGNEVLLYYRGGFGELAKHISDYVKSIHGEIHTNEKIIHVDTSKNKIVSIKTPNQEYSAKHYLFTPSFSQIADLFRDDGLNAEWINNMRRIKYLGNICLVLRLDKSLSDTYWLNVNDPGFPFVGVIEHTNFDKNKKYNDSHIVYLSRYLSKEDPVWSYDNHKYLNYCIKYIKKMFPQFNESWINEYSVWKEEYAQPITELNYSKILPGNETPYVNASISTMAQIYPEDRGTNYAVRDGRKIAKKIMKNLASD